MILNFLSFQISFEVFPFTYIFLVIVANSWVNWYSKVFPHFSVFIFSDASIEIYAFGGKMKVHFHSCANHVKCDIQVYA